MPIINGVPLYRKRPTDREEIWYTGIEAVFRVESIRPETLGGAISSLNMTIMTTFKSSDVNIRKWYPDVARLVDEYLQQAKKGLEDVGWKFPEYLGHLDTIPMYEVACCIGNYYALKYDETFIVQNVE